jgi:hypothetical protein
MQSLGQPRSVPLFRSRAAPFLRSGQSPRRRARRRLRACLRAATRRVAAWPSGLRTPGMDDRDHCIGFTVGTALHPSSE